MKYPAKTLLSISLFCNFAACSLMDSDPVDNQFSEQEIEPGSAVDEISLTSQPSSGRSTTPEDQTSELSRQGPEEAEVITEESDIWSIEVSAGETATMSAPVRARLQAPDRKELPVPTAHLFWRMPQSTVTHYLIRFGYSPADLSEQIIVSIEQLDEVSDEIQGLLYRYTLHAPKKQSEISQAEDLYYRVQAFNQSRSSPVTPLARAQLTSPE